MGLWKRFVPRDGGKKKKKTQKIQKKRKKENKIKWEGSYA
jgi:hypothetical protein